MAFVCNKVLLRLAPRCRDPKLLNSLKCHPGQGAVVVQVANLTSVLTHGDDIVRHKPFPYKKTLYKGLWQYDSTRERFNDNSKVVVVEGNLATGKTAFGEQMAKEFDMKFFPDEFEDNMFKMCEGDYDYRQLNPYLSPQARFLDVSTFQTHSESPAMLKTIGRTQLHIYRYRYWRYAEALAHLFNTGQGVIVERGPWGDAVFAEALRKLGYLSPKAYRHYNSVYKNSVCEFWKPHLVIYLDAPLPKVRECVNARNVASEVKGKVVTDEYLKTIDNIQRNKLLPNYSKQSNVLSYDLTDMPEWEVIVEDLQVQDLEYDIRKGDHFKDWSLSSETDWNLYRVYMSNPKSLETNFKHFTPMDCPEMAWVGEDYFEVNKLIQSIPEACYADGYVPGKDNYLFKL